MSNNLTLIAASILLLVSGAVAQAAPAGRQIEAPAWSLACMTDHGPSRCGEPVWAYGRID